MEVGVCHTEGRRSFETDDGARRYDKAGVPEGSYEQPVFTVKAIFINLYTCRRSAPLPIADFEHKYKDKDKDKHKN